MYEINTSGIWAYVDTLLRLVGGGLRLDQEAFRQVYLVSGGNRGLLLWIVIVAGLSLMIGQSVVLFANRVSKGRFAVSLLLGAVKFALDVLVIILSVWVMVNILGEKSWEIGGIARAIALASAPYWLSVLFLIPYLGLILERVVKIYVFMALVIALQAVFEVPFLDAILAALISLGISYTISLLLGRLLTPINDRITRTLFGELEFSSTRDIYEQFAKREQ